MNFQSDGDECVDRRKTNQSPELSEDEEDMEITTQTTNSAEIWQRGANNSGRYNICSF